MTMPVFEVPPLKDPLTERFCDEIAIIHRYDPAEASRQYLEFIKDNNVVYWVQLAIRDRIQYLSKQKSKGKPLLIKNHSEGAMPLFRPKSVVVYRITRQIDFSNIAEQLKSFEFKPCGPQDMARTGWISPLGEEYEELTHQANGLILLTQRNESKIIPPATVKELVRQRVTKLEKEQHRRLKRTEISALNDLVLGELLPKALSKYANMNMWIDPKSRLIIVETTSFKRAEDAAALLRKTLGSLPIIPFTLETPVELKLTEWVRSSELPPGLALCDEATLEAILEDGGVVTTKRQDLVCDEIANHIEAGKLVTKLAMSWMEQLNFVINDSFVISRLNFADALIEQNDDIDREDEVQRFDADFVLFTGVIMELLDQLIAAFGGEAKSSAEGKGDSKEEGGDSGESDDDSSQGDDE